MTCECELAGFCTRHGMEKTEHWHRLCQRDDYFAAWEAGRGPGQKQERKEPTVAELQKRKGRLAILRNLWRELHTQANPTPDWFDRWLRRVPQFGCSCREHFRAVVRKYPPDFSSRGAFFAWSVDAHNVVNQRLGKPSISLEDAWSLYS